MSSYIVIHSHFHKSFVIQIIFFPNNYLFAEFDTIIYLLSLIHITLMLSKIFTVFRFGYLSKMQQPQLAVYYVTASSNEEAESIAAALV